MVRPQRGHGTRRAWRPRAIGDRHGVAGMLLNLRTIARDQGDLHRARSLLEQSLMLVRERGEKVSVSAVLNNLASEPSEEGDGQ